MDKRAAAINESKKATRHLLGNKTVNHLRSTTLGMCSLFSLSRAEVADLTSCLEAVDPAFSKQVNLYQFCELFCPRWKHCFKYLYSQYESLPVFSTPGLKTGSVVAANGKHSASYFNLLSFLFLLVPLDRRDLMTFLFLICYEHIKVRPKCDHITETAAQLWGDRDGSKKAVSAVKFVARSVDIEMFDASKLDNYDISSKKAFSTPILKLIDELRKNICGKIFWLHLTAKIVVLKSEYEMYSSQIERLRDMLDASEECDFVDTVKESMEKTSQLDSFELCFAYVHRIEGGFRSMKRDSEKRGLRTGTFVEKVVAVAELPGTIYNKYFGPKAVQSQYKQNKVAPFREKPIQYNMKGYAAVELFALANKATYRSEGILDLSDETLDDGKRQDAEIDKILRNMKKSIPGELVVEVGATTGANYGSREEDEDEEDDDNDDAIEDVEEDINGIGANDHMEDDYAEQGGSNHPEGDDQVQEHNVDDGENYGVSDMMAV